MQSPNDGIVCGAETRRRVEHGTCVPRGRVMTSAMLLLILCRGVCPVCAADAGQDAGEQAAVKSTLPAETIEKAREHYPEMLELRLVVDSLWRNYEHLALTMGRDKRRNALREIPKVKRDLEKAVKSLEGMYDNALDPMRKEREKLEKDEQSVFKRIDRLENRGKDAGEEREEADKINRQKQVIEEKNMLLQALGHPPISLGDPEDVLLAYLIKPDRQQASILRSLAGAFPDLVEGRFYIAHVDADLAELKERVDNGDRRAERTHERLRQRRENAMKKFARVFLDIRQDLADQYHKLMDDRDRLMPRVERERERGRTGRNEQRLSTLEKQIDGLRRRIEVLDRFVKDIDAVSAEALKVMLARESDTTD